MQRTTPKYSFSNPENKDENFTTTTTTTTNTVTDDKCNKRESGRETTEHILSECTALAAKEYVNRHNNVVKILHHEPAMKRGLIEASIPYYKYTPHTILENARYKLYWDRTVSNKRPDITLIDKVKKKTFLIDTAIPSDHRSN
jgi:hypothetical protein